MHSSQKKNPFIKGKITVCLMISYGWSVVYIFLQRYLLQTDCDVKFDKIIACGS